MGNKYPNLEDFLGMFETECFNEGYDLDLSNPAKIVIRPKKDSSNLMPTVYGTYEESEDGAFWFNPSIEFPVNKLDVHNVDWTFSYPVKEWVRAAKLADYLFEHAWDKNAEFED